MDEPFSSLDVYSRESARESLKTLKAATGAAVVLVTHDLFEAADLADRDRHHPAGKQRHRRHGGQHGPRRDRAAAQIAYGLTRYTRTAQGVPISCTMRLP